DPVMRALRKEMDEAAEQLQFERAALLRDRIRLIERLTERQKITSTIRGDQDVIAFARDDGEACVEVFFIRDGKLSRSERFFLDHTDDQEATSIMQGFVEQFYDNVSEIPEEIVLEHAADEMEILKSWLSKKRGGSVQIAVPRRGEKRKLAELAAENARVALTQMRAKWMADREKTRVAIDELQEALALPASPRRIECYDISNTQ